MTTATPAPAPRGARFSPDRPFVGYLVTILVLLVMLAAMAFSFIALYESAEWTHNPREFWWLAPVIIDGPILVYTASYAIWRWRAIDKFAAHAMRVLIFFTGLSVSVNALHVASGWQWAWERPELYGGIAMAAVAPIGALLAAHEVTRLVFMSHDEAKAAEESAAELAVEPSAESAEEEEDYLTPKLDELFDRKPVWADDLVAAVQASAPAPAPEPEAEPDPAPTARPTSSLLFPQEIHA